MTVNDQIRDEKLQYNVNTEAAKISALPWGKFHKYEYLTGKDILALNQQQIMKQAKLTYCPLGKAFEKQIKTIENQWQNYVDALKDLKPITYKSDGDDDESLRQKNNYNEAFDEKIGEIQEISNWL